MTEQARAITCPQCGATVNWVEGALETKCDFCGSVLTKDDIKLVAAKLNEKTIDVQQADIDELHELEKHVGKALDFRVKYNAHRLLITELGDQYEGFIKDGLVKIAGTNGKTYVVHIDGYIECLKDGKQEKDGQIFRDGYPAEDALVTMIRYIRTSSNDLDSAWGCGRMHLKGGNIKSEDV